MKGVDNKEMSEDEFFKKCEGYQKMRSQYYNYEIKMKKIRHQHL